MATELLILAFLTCVALLALIIKFVQNKRKPLNMGVPSTKPGSSQNIEQKDPKAENSQDMTQTPQPKTPDNWWDDKTIIPSTIETLLSEHKETKKDDAKRITNSEKNLVTALTNSNFDTFKLILKQKAAKDLLLRSHLTTLCNLSVNLLTESANGNFEKFKHYLTMTNSIFPDNKQKKRLAKSLIRSICLHYENSGTDAWLEKVFNIPLLQEALEKASIAAHIRQIADCCTPNTFWKVIPEERFFQLIPDDELTEDETVDIYIQRNIDAVALNHQKNAALLENVIEQCKKHGYSPNILVLTRMNNHNLMHYVKDFFPNIESYEEYLNDMKDSANEALKNLELNDNNKKDLRTLLGKIEEELTPPPAYTK